MFLRRWDVDRSYLACYYIYPDLFGGSKYNILSYVLAVLLSILCQDQYHCVDKSINLHNIAFIVAFDYKRRKDTTYNN